MKTLVLWLDAFRGDYITKKDTPFLYSLKKRFGLGTLKQPFGYNSIAASFFTGKTIYEHKQFVMFNYDEHGTRLYPNFLPNIIRSYYSNFVSFIGGNYFFIPIPSNAPLNFFSTTQRKYYTQKDSLPVNTIFDVLDKEGKKYIIYNWPLLATNKDISLTFLTKNRDKNKTSRFLREIGGDYDIYFLHLWDLDHYGHIYGPSSKRFLEHLRQQDNLAEKVVQRFDLEKDNVILWSDHGMLTINKHLDVEKLLPPSDDYNYFLDSTMARFWFSNDIIRSKIINKLNKIEVGHFLSNEERKKYKIDKLSDSYGQEIFLVDPGVLILPNFWQTESLKGMHGYNLEHSDESPFCIINKNFRLSGNIEDLFPTILELVGIEIESSVSSSTLLV